MTIGRCEIKIPLVLFVLELLWTGMTPVTFGQTSRGKLAIFCPAPFVAGGDRGEQEVAEAFQAKMIYFAKCYKTSFAKGLVPTFKVRFRFAIEPSGAISNVKVVHEGIRHRAFVDCLINVIHKIQFTRLDSKSESVVEQSIIFRTD